MKTNRLTIAFVFVALVSPLFAGRALSADSAPISCVNPGCRHAFIPGENKASLWDAVLLGAAVGGSAGAAGGTRIGAAAGVVTGGACVAPFSLAGFAIGSAGGAVGGCIWAAWNRNNQVSCPKCGLVFDIPRGVAE